MRSRRGQRRTRALLSCALAALVVAVPATPAAGQPEAGPVVPPVPVEACHGLHVAQLASGEVICSHGPDAAHPLSTSEDPATASATSSIACIDDGRSGTRVQAIYARAADRADRYATYLDTILGLVGAVDAAVSDSAAQSAHVQRVRWAHDTASPCRPTVLNVVLPTDIDDSASTAFSNTISGLRAQGYDDPSRKYLVFVDAATICGQAQIYNDDSAGGNRNDGGGSSPAPGMVARVDLGYAGCANGLTATHELLHTLGAVQLSAPHSTGTYSGGGGGWHCNDEYDALCYADGASTGTSGHMTYPCGSAEAHLLDCNDDDYYNPAPLPGTYLAGHWNTARSSWLTAPALTTLLSAPGGVAGRAGDASATVSWSPPLSDGGSAITGYTVTASPSGSTVSVPATSTAATLAVPDGSHAFTVTATNEAGDSSASPPSAAVPVYRGGYVVDGWGGIHPLTVAGNPAPPTASGGPYWPDWDIVRGLAVHPRGGGYVVDGWGGIHVFKTGGTWAPAPSKGPYWKHWDIVRGAAVHPRGGGYVVDGWGGLHPFATGGTLPPPAKTAAYWQSWDIVRDVVVHPAGGGYVLDGYGGLHPFSTGGVWPPAVTVTGYWPGWDIARGVVLLRDGSGGYVVDGFGGRHAFRVGSKPLPPASSASTWPGWDIVRDAAV